MRASLIVLALLVAARPASADDTKSPGWALGLSIGGTVAGGMMLGALAGDSEAEGHQILPAALMLLTGPSWGHIYTGDYDLAVGGTLLRVVGLAMIKEGRGDCLPDPSEGASLDDCVYEDPTPGLAAAGTILVLGTALAEIVDAPFAARRYNREHAVTLAPVADKGRYGVALIGRF